MSRDFWTECFADIFRPDNRPKSAECRYCGELIADLESAPKDSMGAYCETCEIEDVVENAINDSVAADEGSPRASTLLRYLAKEGITVMKAPKEKWRIDEQHGCVAIISPAGEEVGWTFTKYHADVLVEAFNKSPALVDALKDTGKLFDICTT